MPTRRVLRSVLWNFLGTYTSRYSDYNEYWLFGFIVRELASAEFDLLAEREVFANDDIFAGAGDLAVREFADQLGKAGLDRSQVAKARLHIEQLSAVCNEIYGEERGGWNYRFRVTATADTGRTFESETIVFVAPNVPEAWLERSQFERRIWQLPKAPVVRGSLDLR